MSSDSSNNYNNNSTTNNSNNSSDMNRQATRRGSVTSAAFTNMFRSNSVSQGTGFPGPITTAAMNDQRRRLSVSTTGVAGTSPTPSSAGFLRRASLSTNNSDENAVDEDDFTRTTPFARRMSVGAQAAMRNMRPGGGSPGTNDQGFNWSEQIRSRAENTVAAAGARSTLALASGASPPRANPVVPPGERTKSVADLPPPPAQTPRARQPQKPDYFQERILKGDFYMD